MSRGSSTLPSSRTRATAHSMPRVLSHRFAATQSHVRRTNSYPIRSNPESTPQGQADIRPMVDIANGGGLGFGRQDLCQSFRGKTQLWLAAATFVLDSAHGCNAWLARCSAASSSPAAISSDTALGILDGLALLLVIAGVLFESLADYQLAAFKKDAGNSGKVMDRGLWRYSRHPNYFGECCVWWGFFLFAVASGGWWTIISPLLMTILLLRVSGVALLEKDIVERRPGYRDYIARTNAFIPGAPRHLRKVLLSR